jgi:iron uptake system component EfeO
MKSASLSVSLPASLFPAVSACISVCALGMAGCDNPSLNDPEAEAIAGVKTYVSAELAALNAAALAVQAAAPAADADGWNADDDAAAVEAMRAEWKNARVHYEHIEGAIAVLFPNLDASTDERYDGFVAETADNNLFDGEGVIGVHGVERIIFSDVIPAHVVAFEEGLGANYSPARFPQNAAEAADFKTGLCQRLVDDTQQMIDEFGPLALAKETAYRGVLGSMQEQFEKVSLAGTGEDESRYANFTLADMRANLAGGKVIFAAFEVLFNSIDGGADQYATILEGFERAQAALDGVDGDGIPDVPPTWNPDAPSEADAATPYGELYLFFENETDPENAAGFVAAFNAGGELLSIPQLAE